MKKNLLKTTALIIALAGLLGSCSLFEDDDDDDSPSKSVTVTKAVLSLSLAGEEAARTALPSVSSAQEFESFDFEAANETASITKLWEGDSEKTAYAKMTSATLELDTGIWNFTLAAKKGGMTYRGRIEKQITAGANRIEFTLSLAELSNEGRGSVEIKLTVPASVKAVTVSLCNTSENDVSDSSIVQSTNLTNNTVSYSAQKVPSGTYLVIFSLYADTAKTLLLGKWREYAGVTSEVKSSSEIPIDAEDLDKVYTITYELNGGTLKGTWCGNYTRNQQNIQIPTAGNVIKDGLKFDGWYIDENLNNAFNSSSLTGNLTLYARWKTFDVDELIESIKNKTIGEKAIPEGKMTSEKLSEIANAMKEAKCCLSLDLSMTNGLTAIGNEFKSCKYLTEIVVPDSVTSIGEYAFSGCGGLTSLMIPDSVTSIGKDAFYDCSKVTNVYYGGTLENWLAISFLSGSSNPCHSGSDLYINGNKLADLIIPDSVTSIGKDAFYGCVGLTSITIPASVTSIGSQAFRGCVGLTSITIPSSVTSIEVGAFYDCSGLTSVTIPASVTSIGSHAFYGCSGLTSITIPANVTSIEKYAFGKCSGLTSITIPESVTSIGERAFWDCGKLTSVTISGSVTSIGERAFLNCDELSSVRIQGRETSIGEWAFRECKNLTSVTLPESVTSIGEYAFRNCTGIKSVYFEGTLEQWLAISFEKDFSNPCEYGSDLYIQGNKLTDLIIPDSVTSIGKEAFYGCVGLTSITIPSSVTSIGGGAFGGCSGLTSVTIPNSVTSIEGGAFGGCSGLTSMTIPFVGSSRNPWMEQQVFGYIFSTNSYAGGTARRMKYGSSSSSYIDYYIPSSLRTVTVTDANTLSYGAFCRCKMLTSVTISEGVTSIGEYAFYDCYELTSVTIPSSVTSIGENAFQRCSKLTHVYYRGTESQWNAIKRGYYNTPLTDATITYNYIGE